MSRTRVFASALAVAACSCRAELTDHGEALVVVSTDVDVGRFANRLRLDVYDDGRKWIATQDVGVPSVLDWPVSFSVVHPSETSERTVWVRVRAYSQGHVRDYRGERFAEATPWSPARVAEGLPALCAEAPSLELGVPITLRRGTKVLTTFPPFETSCTAPNEAGSVAAKVKIATRGRYSFGILRSSPDARIDPLSAATLAIRSACTDPTAQIACSDARPFPTVSATLDPGTYFVVTGGATATPADLTLFGETAERFGVRAPDVAATGVDRRLNVGGADVTPETEPEPAAAIDRLMRVRLQPGLRGTLRVTLRGECLGTMANLEKGESCIDKAGVRVGVTTSSPDEGIDRGAPTPTPWPAQAATACAGPPRVDAATATHEVCVPGGPFLLGDALALADSDAVAAQPARARVVPAFFLDRFEFSVGRYRSALRTGFTPPAEPLISNPGEVRLEDACTWNEATKPTEPAPGIARETLPLNCVDWSTARALCRFFGGELPTEEQWEFAATASAKPRESQYPWGDELPGCARISFGRFSGADGSCGPAFGPTAIDAAPFATADLTPSGVIGLGGNVAEWTLDGLAGYGDARFASAGMRDPLPFDETAPMRVVRGTSWDNVALWATGSVRRAYQPRSRLPAIGFRCARRGGP